MKKIEQTKELKEYLETRNNYYAFLNNVIGKHAIKGINYVPFFDYEMNVRNVIKNLYKRF